MRYLNNSSSFIVVLKHIFYLNFGFGNTAKIGLCNLEKNENLPKEGQKFCWHYGIYFLATQNVKS